MAVRTSTGTWRGDLRSGSGTVALGSGAFEGPYTFVSRFEEGPGTNPEELVAAAHGGCYAMFLANVLASNGAVAEEVQVTAKVHLGRDDVGPALTKIELVCRAKVPGISPEDFAKHAEAAKAGCPISKALASVPIELDAQLV